MIDSSGDPISGRGVGCWRLMAIQARGCTLTAVHLRRDRRKEQQQQQLVSYMTEHGGDVVGFGDTRLGENLGIMDNGSIDEEGYDRAPTGEAAKEYEYTRHYTQHYARRYYTRHCTRHYATRHYIRH